LKAPSKKKKCKKIAIEAERVFKKGIYKRQLKSGAF
jgi:hypothetical protein|tara:strand:- start:733 stop:840 length:108 start_codon:yes stop_codon:yes gene_type:complete